MTVPKPYTRAQSHMYRRAISKWDPDGGPIPSRLSAGSIARALNDEIRASDKVAARSDAALVSVERTDRSVPPTRRAPA